MPQRVVVLDRIRNSKKGRRACAINSITRGHAFTDLKHDILALASPAITARILCIIIISEARVSIHLFLLRAESLSPYSYYRAKTTRNQT